MTAAAVFDLDEIIPFGGIAGITIAAYSESPEVGAILQKCRESRHLADVRFVHSDSGIQGAIRTYREAQSPHVLIIETALEKHSLMASLDQLAEVCESETRLILIGQANDVQLYRELVRRGVSEYLAWPVTVRQIIRSVAEIEELQGGLAKGRVFAFTGASGGCGSSTIAASAAWLIGHRKSAPTTLIDLDIEFGTLGLNLGINAMRGASDALRAGTRLDSQFLEGLLNSYDDYLRLLASSEQSVDEPGFTDDAIDHLIDTARITASYVVLDVPSPRTSGAHRAIMAADQVFITAAPDLHNLRNAKKLFDSLRRARPDEREPFLVINKVGAAKRYEVPVKEFVEALQCKQYAVVNYEPGVVIKAATQGKSVLSMDRGANILANVDKMLLDAAGTATHQKSGLVQRMRRYLKPLSSRAVTKK